MFVKMEKDEKDYVSILEVEDWVRIENLLKKDDVEKLVMKKMRKCDGEN
jgi:hypothetical protein